MAHAITIYESFIDAISTMVGCLENVWNFELRDKECNLMVVFLVIEEGVFVVAKMICKCVNCTS